MRDEPRLDSLTGLRAAAAGVVLISHLRWLIPDQTLFNVSSVKVNARIVMQQGNVGVSLFFLLSGFVLMWSWRDDRPSRFWGRRFGRIYPLQVIAWTGWMGLVALSLLPAPGTGPAITSLLLVQSWVPNPQYYIGVNPPTWSLSCEVFFYAVFPLVARGLRKLRPSSLPRLAIACGVVAIALPSVLYALERGSSGIGTSGVSFFYLSYVFPPTRLVEFVLGATLALIVASGRWRNISLRWSMLAAVVAYLVAGRAPRILANSVITLVPFAFVLLAAAGADLAGRRTFWRHRVVRHLGEVSYAVFIVQYAVIELLRPDGAGYERGYDSFATGLATAALAVVIIMAIAEALHFAVERPAERWFRRRFPRSDHAALALAGDASGSASAVG